jgi:hypothetical protein
VESTSREEVQQFTRACEALLAFAREHNGLTDEERGVVRNLIRAMEQEVAPASPEPPQDDAPLAAPLAHLPLID